MDYQFFFGLKTSTDSIQVLYSEIKSWLEKKEKSRIITFLNPHVYNYAQKNPVVKDIISHSDMVSIDGVGIKLFLLFRYLKSYPRTIMTHLFDKVVFSDDIPSCNGILIGTTKKLVKRASFKINKQSHGLKIIRSINGFEKLEHYNEVISSTKNIDFVFIGMGTPRSEQLIQSLSQLKLNVILWHIGGGTIKCYANTKRRSPEWLSDIGFEWMHRIIFEPFLMKRYILGIPVFFWNLLKYSLVRKFTKRW